MAARIQIGGSDTERVFIGTDWTKDFKVADLDTDPTGLTAKDITGFGLLFDLRASAGSSTSLFSKVMTIHGTFNSVLATSTQVMRLTILDTDITADLVGPTGGVYAYSIKRTDDGSETILAYGEIPIERATQLA